MPEQVIERSVLPKQMKFIRAQDRFVLYSGCYGGGKSVSLCEKIVARASVPGTREILTRKTFASLRKSTLKTLLEGDGTMPPTLPRGSYRHNKSDMEINIHGGGQIVYMGMDNPDRLGSINATGAAVDEAIELTEQDWNMLRGRIRLPIKGVPNQIYAATNPGPPHHYIAKKFGFGDEPALPGHLAISTKATDNHYLPQAYIDDLKTMEGVAYKRYYLGLWVGAEGVVYDKFDQDQHVTDRSGRWSRSIIACDYGYKDPFAALSMREDHEGHVHIDREVYEQGLTEPEMIERVQSMMDDHTVVLVDNSMPALIESMRRKGLPAFPCEKGRDSVKNGIMQVQSLLGQNKMTVSPSCVNTINEFESYEWRKTKDGKTTDVPVDSMNHAMDSIRYGVFELFGGHGFNIATEESVRVASQSDWEMDEW